MIKLYTDGSCPRNPGPGGWAFCVVGNGNEVTKFGAERDATNNRMELMAVIKGLEFLTRDGYGGERVLIISDSQYVIRGLGEWSFGWKANGWRHYVPGRRMVTVKNVELWKQAHELAHEKMRAEFEWQRGHVGHRYNELVDRLAGEAAWDMIER